MKYLDIRILLTIIYITLNLLHYNKFVALVKNNIPSKFLYTIDTWRLFSWWGMFLGENEVMFDIIITAETSKDKYEWSLYRDKDICGIKFKNIVSRLTLVFYYESNNSFYLTPYFNRKITEYFQKKNEPLEMLQIRRVFYNKYTNEEIKDKTKTLFILYPPKNL